VHGRERPAWSCGVVEWFGKPPNEQPVAWSDNWSHLVEGLIRSEVEDSPPTPGRTVTQGDWVPQTVSEFQTNDPDMAVFVVECDERDKRCAQAPHALPHQGDVTQRDKRVSIQSKGIKKTSPCLWLPVSFCVASRVHSLLSACPASNNINRCTACHNPSRS